MFALPDRKRPRIESEDDVFVKQEPHWPATTLIATDHDTINAQPNSIQELQPEPLDNGGAGRQRDAEFWFGDGTVILVAGDVEFRIYKGLLADYSSVFKTMFAKQHPVRPMPIDERHSIPCPVIRLKDSPQDLRHILRAYVSRKQTSFFDATKPSFHQTSAYIRLGYNYHLHELYDQSLQLLKHHYTDDLQTWAKHNYWKPSHWDEDLYSIGVVNIARLINEPALLPTTLLACIYTPSDIVQGFEREDGTWETLAVEDLGRCFRAMKDIQQTGVDGIVRTFQGPVSATCKSSLVCPAMLTRAKLRHLEANVNGFRSGDPFCALDEIPGMPELETCADCTAMVKERHRREREALWNRLPTLLGVQVPGWGNLKPAPQQVGPGDAREPGR